MSTLRNVEYTTSSGADRIRELEARLEGAINACRMFEVENASLRNALAERNARYWELVAEVERLYKTIEGEKREEGR